MTKKRDKQERPFTSLNQHKKDGSKLLTPLTELDLDTLQWDRDFLPEHIWIASLAHTFGMGCFPDAYNRFMDTVDKYIPGKDVALGLITDFAMIPKKSRKQFMNDNRDLISDLFLQPVGQLLALYPDSPAHWLVSNGCKST